MERAAKIQLLQEKVKFVLPPYFVLILRAFSVIEGIALKVCWAARQGAAAVVQP